MSRYALETASELIDGLELIKRVDAEQEAEETGDYDQLHASEAAMAAEDEVRDTTDTGGSDEPPVDAEGGSNPEDSPNIAEDAPEGENPVEGATEDKESEGKEDESGEKPSESAASEKDKKTEAESGSGDPEQTTENGKRQTPATESLRNEYYDRVVVEGIDWDTTKQFAGATAEVVGKGVGLAFSLATTLTKVLYELGVKYSPGVWGFIKKSTAYLFARSVKLLFKSLVGLSNFVERSKKSFSSHEQKLLKLSKKLEDLNKDGASLEPSQNKFADSKLVSWFTVNSKVSPELSIKTMVKFIQGVIPEINRDIEANLKLCKSLLETSANGISGNPLSVLAVSPLTGTRKQSSSAIKPPSNLVESYLYIDKLPDNVVFAAVMPKLGLKSTQDISSAYNDSGMFLTNVMDQHSGPSELDYMDAEQIKAFLTSLGQLCTEGKKHVETYSAIITELSRLKPGYKNYYQKLTESKEQAVIREQLMEYIFLKQSFVSRVYIPAAIDVHDYLASYLIRAERYIEACIKNLKVKESAV